MKCLRSYKKLFGAVIAALILFLTPFSFSMNVVAVTDIISGGEKLVLQPELIIHTTEALSWEGCTLGTFSCWVFDAFLTIYEFLFYATTQLGVVIIGLMMDAVIAFSISSNFYRSSGIIEAGWEVLRDLTNIVFIFLLLVIAFKMVLGQNDANNKRSLVRTILIALVINFSLFMSYAIIDGSNVLAHVFWNRINTDASQFHENTTDEGGLNIATWIQDMSIEKSPSLAVAGQINPQKIMNASGGNVSGIVPILLLSGTIVLNIAMIYVFFSVMLMFFGRILGLIILVVLSPLAFASFAIPSLRKLPYVGWDSWFPELLKLSFMAPIFLFFLWLTVSFVGNEGVLATLNRSNGDWLTNILNVYLLLGLIGGMLLISKKVTKDLSGKFGSMAADFTQKAIGGTIAAASIAATGGAAAVGLGARGVGAVAGVGAKAGSKRAAFASGASKFGKQAMSLKADVTKLPGFKNLVGKENTDTLSKFTGTSARGLEQKATLGAMKAVDGFKDTIQGRSFKESEAEFEKKKKDIRDNSGKWQEKLDDTESAERIRSQRDDFESTTTIDANLDPRGGGTRNLKEFAKLIRKEFTEAVVLQTTPLPLANTQLGSFNVAELPTSLAGTTAIPAGESRVQFEDRVVKEFGKDIDNIKTDVKSKERDYSAAQATGNTTAITAAKTNLERVERALKDKEKNKEDFEKLTAKNQIEKVENIEKTVETRAKETVAKQRETEGKQGAADRIRKGKVKIEEDPQKK